MSKKKYDIEEALQRLGFPDLPTTWRWARIGDLGEVRLGRQRSPKNASKDYPTKYLRAANIDWGGLKLDDILEMEFTPSELETYRLEKGDVILSEASGSPDEVGKPAYWNDELQDCCFQNTVIRYRSQVTDPKFALYIFYHFARNGIFARTAKGVGIQHLSAARFADIPFPVAPLPEQKRIVSKIEELFSDLDAGVSALERARANLRRYRASVLKSAVEGRLTETWRKANPGVEPASELISKIETPPRPSRYKTRSKDVIPGHAALSVGMTDDRLPKGWARTPLVEIAKMESGHTPSRKREDWWGGDIPWIGIADAREHNGRTIHDTLQKTNEEGLANSASRLLPIGTVCVSRTASVGYVTVMGTEMATSQDFVNWVPTDAVTADWLRVVFSADREALRRFGKGSVHKTIYFPEWLSVHIAVPPIEEQREIVNLVDQQISAIESSEAVISGGLLRAARLRQSILKCAFEGQLCQSNGAAK